MSTPPSELIALPAWAENLSPPSRALLAALRDVPPPQHLDIEQARAQMRIGQDVRIDDYPLHVQRIVLAGCDCTLMVPHACVAPSPPVFFFHGGGWVMGDSHTHAYLLAELAVRAELPLVLIGYPLAPETRFPANLEKAYQIVRQILDAAHCHDVSGNESSLTAAAHSLLSDRFAFAGDSAGGNIAAAMTLLAKRRGEPLPRLQALLYPALDAAMDTESHRDFAMGSNLTRETMQWFWQQYVTEVNAFDPLASPLRASTQDLSGLPPALILTGECDILRDEGEAYARRLTAAGVETTAVRFLGALHGFMTVESIARSEAGQSAISFLAAALRRALLAPEHAETVQDR